MYLKYFIAAWIIGYTNLLGLAQGIWTQKANFGGIARQEAVGLSIGNKICVGTGWNGGCLQDFWEWDPSTNVWTQKANFSGGNRQGAFHFSIGGKGYVGMGWNCSVDLIDFWEWDQATNTWSQKANFPGTPREDGSSFSIGTKGYVGTGVNSNNSTNPNDFWEWDQTTNTWTQKANFGGVARLGTNCRFSIGTKGYIGLGANNSLSTFYNDFWEWDQITDTWTQKANFGGTARAYPSGFAICNKAYVGIGKDASNFQQDFWEWDQTTNTWTQQTSFPAAGRFAAIGISNGNVGYLGTGGLFPSGQFFNDFWEFLPQALTTTISVSASTICIGQSATLSASGGSSYSWSNGSSSNLIIVSPTSNTTYSVIASNSCGVDTTSIIITVNPSPSVSISGNTSICLGDAATLTASGGTSYQWSTGATTSFVVLTPTTTSSYSVIATNSIGCKGTNSITVNVIPCAPPVSAFSASNNTICMNNCVQFNDQSTGSPTSWSWVFPGGTPSSTSQQNPLVCYDSAGTYAVGLMVINSIGNDTSSQSNYITVYDCYCPEIYLPNAFTPNDDNENDFLLPLGTKCVKTFSIAIYNRWGELVFDTTDFLKGWDGIYNSKKENSAVYTYHLQGTYSSGNPFDKKGNVSLIR